MATDQITPGISTHFRWLRDSSYWNLTQGKIYKILKWEDDCYYFLDDSGEESKWWYLVGIEGISYEGNLEKILE